MAYQIQREHPKSGRIQYYKWYSDGRPIFSGKASAAQLGKNPAEVVCKQLAQLYPEEKLTVVGA